MGLGLSYLSLLGASGLFAVDEGGLHEEYCMKKGKIVFPEKTIRFLGVEWKRRTWRRWSSILKKEIREGKGCGISKNSGIGTL